MLTCESLESRTGGGGVRDVLKVPNLPLHPQFSKDVLVNIYSAYIDNFLNAKDAVRVAKEARPAFLKFLEVLWVAQGDGQDPHLGPALGEGKSSHTGHHSLSLRFSLCPWAGLDWLGTCPWTVLSLHDIPHTGAHPPCFWLQQSMRENKEKQALSDLMIKPVQRIPRYELLVKVGRGLGGQGGKAGRRVRIRGGL